MYSELSGMNQSMVSWDNQMIHLKCDLLIQIEAPIYGFQVCPASQHGSVFAGQKWRINVWIASACIIAELKLFYFIFPSLVMYFWKFNCCLHHILKVISLAHRFSSQWIAWAQTSPHKKEWKGFLWWFRSILTATTTAAINLSTEPTARSRFFVTR